MKVPVLSKTRWEKFAIGFYYVYPDLNDGETLTDCQVEISPNEDQGLKKYGAVVVGTDNVSQVIEGGEDGREYNVTFKTTTSGGNYFEDTILILVREVTPRVDTLEINVTEMVVHTEDIGV